MAPKRKPEPVRRNQRSGDDWVDLPADGRSGPVPAVPFTVDLGTNGLAWWGHQWRSPSATQWLESDWPSVVRRAQLEDEWQTSQRAEIEREPGVVPRPVSTALLAEIRHLDATLGLTAKSRRELRWRIVDEAGVSENDEVAPVRRLKVVDSQATG